MNQTALIVELAKQIESQQAAHQIWFWLCLAAISFVFGAAGSFFSEYFKKRGETRAIQADLATIKVHQAAITDAVEKVRTELAHEDWKKRELTSCRGRNISQAGIGVANSPRQCSFQR